MRGEKYEDRNKPYGQKDASEANLPVGVWTFELVNLGTGERRTTQSDASGSGLYAFGNLGPGRYMLREILKNGWMPSSPSGGVYNSVVVNTSGQVVTLDFGNRTIRSLLPPLFSGPTPPPSPASPLNEGTRPSLDETAEAPQSISEPMPEPPVSSTENPSASTFSAPSLLDRLRQMRISR